MKKEFTILDTDLTDRTGRRYPEETLRAEIERLQTQRGVGVLGELGIGRFRNRYWEGFSPNR